jgi:hypothetical protein
VRFCPKSSALRQDRSKPISVRRPSCSWAGMGAGLASTVAISSWKPESNCRNAVVRGYNNALSSRRWTRSRCRGDAGFSVERGRHNAILGFGIAHGKGQSTQQARRGEWRKCFAGSRALLPGRYFESGRPLEFADLGGRKRVLRTGRARKYIVPAGRPYLFGTRSPDLKGITKRRSPT